MNKLIIIVALSLLLLPLAAPATNQCRRTELEYNWCIDAYGDEDEDLVVYKLNVTELYVTNLTTLITIIVNDTMNITGVLCLNNSCIDDWDDVNVTPPDVVTEWNSSNDAVYLANESLKRINVTGHNITDIKVMKLKNISGGAGEFWIYVDANGTLNHDQK